MAFQSVKKMNNVTKSFGNRLILNFTFIVFGGFLAVYFLFNTIMDNHIRSEAEIELDREITTFVENEMTISTPITGFDGNSHFEIVFSAPLRRNRTILNVDTILLDHQGTLLLPTPFDLPEDEKKRVEALVTFYNDNQSLFEGHDDMIMTTHQGDTFYLRATPHYLLQSGSFSVTTIPVSVLMYTDITPAMNLKNSMNQILLVLLGISGAMSLGISIMLSSRFKKAIHHLAKHAQVIGQGQFNQKIDGFNYAEFNDLASSMNNMANMLGSYEANQKQFFQNASHELRTPLMSIQGYTEGIQLGVFTPEAAASVILEESHKMTELVNDILYLSRLNTTSVESELNLSWVHLDQLLMSCVERVKIIAEKANKRVIGSFGSTAHYSIKTDQDKLERAVINILTNAIRYATSEIQITALRRERELTIIITNDGPVIDEKDLPHIFDRFYKGKGGNTGIGLAITQEIVTRLGGSVKVLNLNDAGVQFIMTFPHVKEQTQQA